jgi:hypothetical protein
MPVEFCRGGPAPLVECTARDGWTLLLFRLLLSKGCIDATVAVHRSPFAYLV